MPLSNGHSSANRASLRSINEQIWRLSRSKLNSEGTLEAEHMRFQSALF